MLIMRRIVVDENEQEYYENDCWQWQQDLEQQEKEFNGFDKIKGESK